MKQVVEKAPSSAKRQNPLLGTWIYRSFLDDPDLNKEFNAIGLGKAKIIVEEADGGVFFGRFVYSESYQLRLTGSSSYGNPFTVRFQGVGITTNAQNHVYDFVGYLAPIWPNGIDQRPAIIGSMVRTVGFGSGATTTGTVVSWTGVKES